MTILRSLVRSPTGVIGVVIVMGVILCAVFASFIAPYDPNETDLLNALAPPAWSDRGDPSHLLGTDKIGRDILSRIIHGTRTSLVTALVAVAAYGLLGTLLGVVAGYAGPVVQNVVMRLVDITLAIPFILFALVIISVLGSSLLNLIITFIAIRWVQFTRIVYAQTLEVKERDFVLAARATGAAGRRIVLRYLLPNVMGPVLVVATLEVGFVILLESGLSFLGLGVPPRVPSWGSMLQEGRNLINIAGWLTTFPGLAIVLTVMGFNFIGDWLRDLLDPRSAS